MRKLLGRCAAIVLAGTAGAAAAASPEPAVPAAPAVESPAPFAPGSALSDDKMRSSTAREDISLHAESRQTSSVSNNSVSGNSVTGEILISDTAFNGASGLTLMNLNTGNNVSMNSSMNVNVIMAPPPPGP